MTDSGGKGASVGAQFYVGNSVHLTVAWRTDERASLTPEARLLFMRSF